MVENSVSSVFYVYMCCDSACKVPFYYLPFCRKNIYHPSKESAYMQLMQMRFFVLFEARTCFSLLWRGRGRDRDRALLYDEEREVRGNVEMFVMSMLSHFH